MFGGAIVAIITPFRNGKVDEDALRKLIEEQIAAGTDGIAPCGTTGESTTLSHEEHDRVIEITIDAVRKRVPVIAGTGSNSTAEALRLTRHAWEAGADGALIDTDRHLQHPQPDGNKPPAGDPGEAREDPEHRRGEGGVRLPQADE
jgi:dihydrodipicolinate synthase/N-acetylneuraminate lyase